ncbi:glycosyltransferase family 2 protein [Halomonas sp. A29]|uniref:glycosyltransferase family 2 protein n=1 Tax=Halomonas sp. A29 TaxID=3102786 RepID=UPI00398AE96E
MEYERTPFFSVVVPVYNKAAYLEEALESLYAQHFTNFEIIAVDDGSVDGSWELLELHHRQGRIRLYRRDRPGPGGYAARNHGASLARGQWLVFQDADDWCSKDHLAEFNANIRRSKDSSIKLYVNAYAKRRGDTVNSAIALPHSGKLTRQQGLELFSRSDYIHMNGACIERKFFQESGGFPEGVYRRGGDVYYWLRTLASLHSTHYSRKITSHWNIDNCGISNNLSNLVNTHPARDSLDKMPHDLTWKEAYYAKKAINRKLISWAVEKKRHGMSIAEDIKSLHPGALSLRQVLHCLTLVLPDNLFVHCRTLVGKTL